MRNRNLEMKHVLTVGMLALLLSVPALAVSTLPTMPKAQDETGIATPDKTGSEPLELMPAKPAKAKKPRRAPADSAGTSNLDDAALETVVTLDAPTPPSVPGVEHVLFERRPVTAVVEIGRERLVHFPFEVAIHKPEQTDGPLDVQLIGNTAYLNAKTPMAPLRLVAEGLDGQGMIPINVVVRAKAPGVPDDLEIQLASFAKAGSDTGKRRADAGDNEDDEPAPPDLVQLSRYCAQMLYAPQRLIKPLRGVRQVDVRLMPVANLYRGGALITTPIGAWRAGTMYVTAVRFTNRTNQAVELDMDQLRGHWTAATPQHWRLLPQGSEADTTAVCLISEQAFDAARP